MWGTAILILILIFIFIIYRDYEKQKNEQENANQLKKQKDIVLMENFKKEQEELKEKNRPKNVVLDIKIGGNDIGKIEIHLYDGIVPKTSNNFRTLAMNGKYDNCLFHRVIKDFMIQGGDFTDNNGTGGHSIYGDKFEDENFNIKHDKVGLLSMANSGPNTNGSQFFITTKEVPHLDGKHVVFGEVVKGMNVLELIENSQTDFQDKPVHDCVISRAYTI